MTAQKLAAEEAIRACGVPFTIFCPILAPGDAAPLRSRRAALDDRRPAPVRPLVRGRGSGSHDLSAYQREGAANKKLFIHGPEGLTTVEALERYCQAFHPEVASVPLMPVEAARATAASTGNQMLGFFAELMAYFEKAGEPGDPTEANQLLGAPATTLDDWIERRIRETA